MFAYRMHNQMIGGGNCSLCKSPGTNMSTCPLNPNAAKPNPAKHPLAAGKPVSPSAQPPPVPPSPPISQPSVPPQVPPPIPTEPTTFAEFLSSTSAPIDLTAGIRLGKKKAEPVAEPIIGTATTSSGKKVMKKVTLIDIPPNGCATGKIGPRPTMEDEHVTASFDDYINLYAVFDGHGGARVSKFLVDELPNELYKSLKDIDLDDRSLVKQTIIGAYARIDRKIYDTMDIQDGSTAVAILQIYDVLYFINLGDSRAILVDAKTGRVEHATTDQKPNDERARIMDAGGFVIMGRVNGVLAVARAFGDLGLKKDENDKYMGANGPVSTVPVITTYIMTPGETYIAVLACDGLWDVMNNNDVAKKLPPTGQLQKVCESLIDEALTMGSRDNVSVMVTVLKAPE